MKQLRITSEGVPYARPFAHRVLYLFEIFFIMCLWLGFVPLMISIGSPALGLPESFAWYFMLFAFCAVPVIVIDFFVRRLWLFLLCLPCFGLLLLIPGPVTAKVFYGLVAGVCVLVLLVRRFSSANKPENQSIGAFVAVMIVNALLYFYAGSEGLGSYRLLVLLATMFFCLLFFYLLHEGEVDYRLFLKNHATFDQPVYSVRSMNRRIFRIYLIAMGLLFFGLMLFPWDDMSGFQKVGDFLLRIFLSVWLFLVNLIKIKEGDPSGAIGGNTEQTSEESADGVTGGATEPGVFWQITEYLFIGLLAIAAVALLCYICYRIYKAFYGRSRLAMEKVTEEEKVRETNERIPREKRSRGTWRSLGPENQIRRKYYRFVGRFIDKKISRADTPRETQNIMNSTELNELLPQYEKVRYANHETEKENFQ